MFELPKQPYLSKGPATKEEEKEFYLFIENFTNEDLKNPYRFPVNLILKIVYVYEKEVELRQSITPYAIDQCLKKALKEQISQIVQIFHGNIDYYFDKILRRASDVFRKQMLDVIFCTKKSYGMGISTFFKLYLFQNIIYPKGYPYRKDVVLSLFKFGKEIFTKTKLKSDILDVKYVIFNELAHLEFLDLTLKDVFETMGTQETYRCIYQRENYKYFLPKKYLLSKIDLDCVKKPIAFGKSTIHWNTHLHLFPPNEKRKSRHGKIMTLILGIKRLQKVYKICKVDPALFEFMFESLHGVDLAQFLLN